ncbi:MAG TPA: helix-turn-helix domain-containing protein [Thermomicrobiales bacterium]
MEIQARIGRTLEDLLHQDHYTPEELAALLDMDVNAIRAEIFHRHLKAFIVDHHIMCIRREDVLRWLSGSDEEPRA